MSATEAGLIKASNAFRKYEGRLPWRSRPRFYLAISRGEVPSVRFGSAIYVPIWALEALANGDVGALNEARQSTGIVA